MIHMIDMIDDYRTEMSGFLISPIHSFIAILIYFVTVESQGCDFAEDYWEGCKPAKSKKSKAAAPAKESKPSKAAKPEPKAKAKAKAAAKDGKKEEKPKPKAKAAPKPETKVADKVLSPVRRTRELDSILGHTRVEFLPRRTKLWLLQPKEVIVMVERRNCVNWVDGRNFNPLNLPWNPFNLEMCFSPRNPSEIFSYHQIFHNRIPRIRRSSKRPARCSLARMVGRQPWRNCAPSRAVSLSAS